MTFFGFIGGTRFVRTRTHLLEVVSPILEVPHGRFYFCGTSHDGRGYQRAERSPEYANVRAQLEAILALHPGLTADHPFFKQPNSGLHGWCYGGLTVRCTTNVQDR